MDKISVLARAKINLNLEITGKRPNGYHDIASVFQSVSLSDRLDIALDDSGFVTLSTKGAEIVGKNLSLIAAELFLREISSPKGAKITLTKSIPLSSGMGGGSADAAATLIALNTLFGYPLTENKLLELGLSLGADVPFCLLGGTKKAEGLGEILTPITPLSGYYCIIIKTFKKSSTGDMYRLTDSKPYGLSKTDRIAELLSSGDISGLNKLCRNDFLAVSPDKDAQEKIIKELYSLGADLAGLTGSGPTLFGLFKENPEKLLPGLKEKYAEVYLAQTVNTGVEIIFE